MSLTGSEALFVDLLNAGSDELLSRLKDMRRERPLTGLEQNILNLVLSHQKSQKIREAEGVELGMSREDENQGMSRALRRIRAPAYSVASAVQSLSDKLKE